MNSRAEILEGGEFGPAAVAGNSGESLLIELINSEDKDERMPSKGEPLTAAQKAILAAWIDQGMEWSTTEYGGSTWNAPLAPRKVSLPRGKGIHKSKHPVDRILGNYLEENELEVPDVTSDFRFMRRVYLDVIGLLPNIDQVDAFVKNSASDKRGELVDALLADNQSYAEHWMTFWNDSLRNDYKGTGYIDGGRKQITQWLYGALYENKPYDRFARELIAPRRNAEGFIGGIKWRGAETANQKIPIQAARSVSQVFLGVNLKCASCHDSFVNKWKLSDAWGMAGAFSKETLELVRCDVPTGEMAETRFLWPELGSIDGAAPVEEKRAQLAGLVTSPKNGRFARVMTNRIWGKLMGRGLVEPMDSLDSQPWSEDLLDWLAKDFADNGYDVKHLIRTIVTSKTYQLKSDTRAPEDEYAFAGPVPRRLSVEQWYDAMGTVTNVWHEKPSFTPRKQDDSASIGTVRAWRVPADELMRTLGRPNREQIVLARETDYSQLHTLEMTNGNSLAKFLVRSAQNLLASGAADRQEVFRLALGRHVTMEEEKLIDNLGPTISDPETMEDWLWMLFNHPEFQMVF